MTTTVWTQWVRQPQKRWLRRALFQVHLWTGIGVGLYMLVIGVTGSVLVFRPELSRAFTPKPEMVAPVGTPLTDDGLKRAAQRVYPDYRVTQIFRGRVPNRAVEIWMEQGGSRKQRLFNQYTGEDLRDSISRGFRFVSWLLDLHDNLLGGDTGKTLNGIGGICLTALCLTGAVIWWPGSKRWRRSLMVRRTSSWKRFNWELHSTIGFWTFVLLFVWAVSGIYLVFPSPFMAVVDWISPVDQTTFELRVGDRVLEWIARLHFGRFAGLRLKIVYAVLGLSPPFLFATGAIMWWNRVLRHGPHQSDVSE